MAQRVDSWVWTTRASGAVCGRHRVTAMRGLPSRAIRHLRSALRAGAKSGWRLALARREPYARGFLDGQAPAMMNDADIAAMAAELESFHVERKRSMADKSKIEEAICAFANDLPASGRPGVLLVGVADDGSPCGLAVTDQLLQNLASIRSDGAILPFPQITVEKRGLQGSDIAVVVVDPSRNTPLRLRGRVCVRVGPRRDTATRDEERVLTERRRRGMVRTTRLQSWGPAWSTWIWTCSGMSICPTQLTQGP